MSFLSRLSLLSNKIAIWLSIACILTMITTLFIGVFFRYALNSALTWSDEVALLAFSWSIFLYSSVLVKEKAHANLTIILDKLPRRLFIPTQKANHLLIIFFGLMLLIAGYQFLNFTLGQVSPTLRYPLWIQVAPIPISGLLIVLHSVCLLFEPTSSSQEKNYE